MDQTLFDQIADHIRAECDRPNADIQPATRLQEDLGMESLQLVMLQVALEDTFRFTFDPLRDDFRLIFQTAGALCAYVKEKTDG